MAARARAKVRARDQGQLRLAEIRRLCLVTTKRSTFLLPSWHRKLCSGVHLAPPRLARLACSAVPPTSWSKLFSRALGRTRHRPKAQKNICICPSPIPDASFFYLSSLDYSLFSITNREGIQDPPRCGPLPPASGAESSMSPLPLSQSLVSPCSVMIRV